jgi:hypothetical protein
MRPAILALALLIAGCSTTRESYPGRTATEQMLVSEAAEDAARQLVVRIPENRRCFLDTTNFEGVDARYAVSAIRQKLMEQGLAIVEDRQSSDTIIEVRAGALSIDSHGRTILLPTLPVGSLVPQTFLPLTFNQWSKKVDEGIAKISAFAYDRASGRLISVSETVVGRSQRARSTISR